MTEWGALPATVRQCWLLIKEWEADKVKAETKRAGETETRDGRRLRRTPL